MDLINLQRGLVKATVNHSWHYNKDHNIVEEKDKQHNCRKKVSTTLTENVCVESKHTPAVTLDDSREFIVHRTVEDIEHDRVSGHRGYE
jgi:hypothetical protein